MIVSKPQEFLMELLVSNLEIAYTRGLRAIGNTNENGQVIGVVGYDYWTGSSCEMHMWGRHQRWVTPMFMHAIFKYPFIDCKCNVVLVRIASGNLHALDIAKRVGFRTECVLAGAHPDGALHILSMYKDNCKWLERHHGFESTAPATCT